MIENRRDQRFETDIPVSLVSVLDEKGGRIVDLSQGGAQIVGASFPRGTRFHIDFMEQTVFAKVMWDEVDRMGVRFEYPLVQGPLYNVMNGARLLFDAPRPYVGAGAIRPATGFGRRAAA